jgi:hypothetical protein
MKVCIDNSGKLSEMLSNGQMLPIQKPEKGGGTNYFLSPVPVIYLYKAKVIMVSNSHIVFSFEKADSINLMMMLRSISESISKLVKSRCDVDADDTYMIHSELDSTFTIRCHIPKSGDRYRVSCMYDGFTKPFRLPRIGAVFDCVGIEIKNLWNKDKRLSYNVDLSYVKV